MFIFVIIINITQRKILLISSNRISRFVGQVGYNL